MIDGVDDPRLLELLDLQAADTSGVDLELLARGVNGQLHAKQLEFMLDEQRRIALMCSRRAGKTYGIAGRLAKRAVERPGSNRVYIALTKDQTRHVTMWEPIWRPLCARLQLCTEKDHDETSMVTYLPNGSTIRFTGSDDIRKIPTELGGALDEAVIDEAQDQADRVLVPLVEKILPPALGIGGTLMLSGVVPDVAAGFYWRTWLANGWSNHNFSMFDNPHYENPQGVVDEYLRSHPGLTVDDPLIQRDYYGRFVFDPKATAYTYQSALNGYVPEEPDWLQAAYSSGLDFCHPIRPGVDGDPRYGLMAAKPLARLPPGHVQHVFDWSSPRGAKLSTHQYYAVAALAQRHFSAISGKAFSLAIDPGANVDRVSIQGWCWDSHPGYVHWRYDAGSSQNTIDNLRRDYGIGVILAAKKTDLRGQVDRFNDTLTRGRARVMIGSALEQDLETARWDKDAQARGQLKWSSNWHPDPSEAARYALQDYFEGRIEPERPVYATEILAAAAAAKAFHDKRFSDKRPQLMTRRKPDIWGKGWRPQ